MDLECGLAFSKVLYGTKASEYLFDLRTGLPPPVAGSRTIPLSLDAWLKNNFPNVLAGYACILDHATPGKASPSPSLEDGEEQEDFCLLTLTSEYA